MGLFEKALRERKAGKPEAGSGLFSKALDALEASDESDREQSEPAPVAARRAAGKPVAAAPLAAKPVAAAPLAAKPVAAAPLAPKPVAAKANPPEPLAGKPAAPAPAAPAPTAPKPIPQKAVAPKPAQAAAQAPEPVSAVPGAGVVAAPEAFPFSSEELDQLAVELERLPAGTDELLAAYARIAEALPLQGLALLLAEEGGVQIAAERGLGAAADSCDGISLEVIAAASEKGSCGPRTRRLLSPLLKLPADRSTRIYSVGEGARAVWLYADARLDASSAAQLSSAESLFASTGGRGTPLPLRGAVVGTKEAAAALEGEAAFAAVILLELKAFIDDFELLVPGLRRHAIEGALRSAATSLLGANGAAFCLSGERLAAFLYSGIRLDAELALAQFRKSLRRSLPFLGMAELPEGRALGLDLGYEGAAGLLERFLAE